MTLISAFTAEDLKQLGLSEDDFELIPADQVDWSRLGWVWGSVLMTDGSGNSRA